MFAAQCVGVRHVARSRVTLSHVVSQPNFPTWTSALASVRWCGTSSSSIDARGRWQDALDKQAQRTGDTYLVVGGGFLGQRITDALLFRGESNVRIFDAAPCHIYDGNPRVQCIQGDVRDAQAVESAVAGVDTVFATFAAITFTQGLPHQVAFSESVNVKGTQNLIDASLKAGARRFIQTSTSHVCLTPDTATWNMDETAPYIGREDSHNHYSWSKAEAEQAVLTAAGQKLAACAVRPCSGIFGHNDKLILQKSLDDGMAVMPFPKAFIDWVYVDNVVWGHLLAERGLQDGTEGVSGNAFCVTNDEPVDFEGLYQMVQRYQPKLKLVNAPITIICTLANVVSFLHSVLKGRISLGKDLDMLTPAAMSTFSMSYTFSSGKARNTLGYEPLFSLEEGVRLTVEGHGGKNPQTTEYLQL